MMDFVGTATNLYQGTPPMVIHEDNEACIAQVQKGYSRTDATKHIDPKYIAWVAQENGATVNVQSIASAENTADIFTKALPRVTHEFHCKGLGLVSRESFIVNNK
jgi:ribosomal protein L24E